MSVTSPGDPLMSMADAATLSPLAKSLSQQAYNFIHSAICYPSGRPAPVDLWPQEASTLPLVSVAVVQEYRETYRTASRGIRLVARERQRRDEVIRNAASVVPDGVCFRMVVG